MIHNDVNQIPEEVTAARSLAQFALEHGWSFVVTPPQPDSAGDPFFSMELGVKGGERFRITWHTRATGGKTYRLFGKTWRPAGRGVWVDAPSLKKIREVIANAAEEPRL
jgi:hypothetical protein